MDTYADNHYLSARSLYPAGMHARGIVGGWVLGMTLSGRVQYRTPAGMVESRRGEVVLFRAGTMVEWTVPEGVAGWACVYSIFLPRPHWMPWLNFRESSPGHVFLRPSRGVAATVRENLMRAHRRFNGPGGLAADFARIALEQALLALWSECAPIEITIDPRITATVDFLNTTLSRPVKLEQMAGRCGMSRSHFAALFKRQMGISPNRFQERLRLERAMQMLHLTVDPVGSIARSLGFHDAQYFCNRFRRLVGDTPRRYRSKRLPGRVPSARIPTSMGS
ncbi:MAG: helix-turn-helix domain-containing protein [Planctomycetes bacterium]|nr:helix-turn-helix domain-containing protein [Planctomycetota bacterium]